METSFVFWRKWLTVISAIMAIMGVVLAVGAGATWLAFVERPLLAPFFGGEPLSTSVASFQRFSFGVIGGVTTGLGLFAVAVARGPFARREPWAWQCFAIGISGWYIVDTGASAAAGSMLNVAGNTLFAVLFALPLVFTRQAFARS
jgi:uncharacterized membrane protein